MTVNNLANRTYYRWTMLLCFGLFLGVVSSGGDQGEPSEVLIGNELRDIAMDEDYVWIATEKGVNRYGRGPDEWEFFTVADGLVSNLVNCIAPERVEGILTKKSGNEVWFGTDSGISVYDKKANSWRSYTTRDGLIHNKINAISVRGGDVWIGTDRGVSVYDKKMGTWMSYTSFPQIPTSKVTTIYHESAYAWIGTQKGLARYNYAHKKWENFKTQGSMWLSPGGGVREATDSPIPDDRINSIDGEGRYVYIATKNSLVEYDRHIVRSVMDERTAYSQLGRGRRAAVNSLYKSRWLEPGVRLLMSRSRESQWEKLGWKHTNISSLMGDKRHEVSDNFLDVKYRSGQAWVATSRGLVQFDSWMGERQIFGKETGLIDDEVTTIATIGSEVWAGTFHGLGRYNLYTRSWTNYRMERALPSSYITALAEDKDGMWFATRGAVSSFSHDSERWKTFTRDAGLAGANINSIAVVGNYVWFGTDEGVSRLDKSAKKWDNFSADKTGLASNDVTSILVDGKYVWIGTKAGLNRYDDTTGEWVTYSTSFGLLDNHINVLAADPAFVWVGTRWGLNRYDKLADKWSAYTTADGLSSDVITSLALDKKRVWVATKLGLNALDRKTEKWTRYTDEPINAIAVEGSDKIWIGGRGNICRYELAAGECRSFTDADEEGLSRVNVYGIQNTLRYVWVATDGGIFRYNKLDDTWWTYSPTKQRGSRDTLVDGSVQAIAGNADFVYFGTAAGISRYDKMTGNWLGYTDADGLIGADVRTLLLDGPDLWIGTQNGITRYDTVSDTWTDHTRMNGLPFNEVFSLAMDNGRIWAGTRGGAAFLEKGESGWGEITTANGLPDNHVWWVTVDNSHVWFGTNKGAARYDPADNSWLLYTTDDGLLNDVVLSIGFEDKYVFLNTPSGTSIYDRDVGAFTPFSRSDGLAGEMARCIAVASSAGRVGAERRNPRCDAIAKAQIETKQRRPEHNLPDTQEIWIGTDGGATRYDLVTDTAESITSDDGLASNNVQAAMVDGQYVWFGTDSGASRYDSSTDEWTTFRKAATSRRDARSSGLISYNVKSLAVDGNYLWVGTRVGLSRYDKVTGSWTSFPLVLPAPEGIPSLGSEPAEFFRAVEDLVTGLASGEMGEPGMGSPLGARAQIPPISTPAIRTIAADGRYLWLGSDAGLFMYDRSLSELVGFTSAVSNIKDIGVYKGMVWVVCDDKIAAFERGSSHDSWIFLSDAGIDVEMTSGGESFSAARKDLSVGAGLTNLTSAAVTGDLLWLGRERGLRIYNVRDRKPVTSIQLPESISGKKITAIAVEAPEPRRQPYLWIGTRDGLYRYDSQAYVWKLFTESNGLASNRVSAIAVEDGYVWVGSSDRGVSRYDRSTALWKIFASESGLADNNVRAIAVDGKYVWFGTFSGGVCRYDKNSDLWTTYRTSRGYLMTSSLGNDAD